jgi:hypothetical protein
VDTLGTDVPDACCAVLVGAPFWPGVADEADGEARVPAIWLGVPD